MIIFSPTLQLAAASTVYSRGLLQARAASLASPWPWSLFIICPVRKGQS